MANRIGYACMYLVGGNKLVVEDKGRVIMHKEIGLLEKLKVSLQGYVYAGEEKKEGWRIPAPMYIFKCSKHGYVKNYVKGYNKRLECPQCSARAVKMRA